MRRLYKRNGKSSKQGERRKIMEDIKALFNETSELASDIGDLTIAWAKKKGHNPNLILKLVGDG